LKWWNTKEGSPLQGRFRARRGREILFLVVETAAGAEGFIIIKRKF
jgi:hypothetical protein